MIHGATAMASWPQNERRTAAASAGGTVAVAFSTLQCFGAPGETFSSASIRRATSGCDDSFSSVRPHGLTTSQRIAATAREGSIPEANAAAKASASRWSKMPITFIERLRIAPRSALAARERRPFDSANARACSFRSAWTWPMP